MLKFIEHSISLRASASLREDSLDDWEFGFSRGGAEALRFSEGGICGWEKVSSRAEESFGK